MILCARLCACHEICSAPICMSALKRGSRRVPASVAKMPRVSRKLSRNRIASTKLSACHAICASVCASVSGPAPVQSLLRQNRPSGVVNKVAFSPPEMPNASRVTLFRDLYSPATRPCVLSPIQSLLISVICAQDHLQFCGRSKEVPSKL